MKDYEKIIKYMKIKNELANHLVPGTNYFHQDDEVFIERSSDLWEGIANDIYQNVVFLFEEGKDPFGEHSCPYCHLYFTFEKGSLMPNCKECPYKINHGDCNEINSTFNRFKSENWNIDYK
jgi:hypothetical protein